MAIREAGRHRKAGPPGPRRAASAPDPMLCGQRTPFPSFRVAPEFHEGVSACKTPEDIVTEEGVMAITDAGTLEAIVDQVMKTTQGKADPKLVNDLLTRKLGS